jgi:copper transport protein
VWFGGLVLLVAVPELRVATTVKWFSQRAAVIIAIAAVTGIAQALLIVEDVGSLVDITYGKTLVAKVVLVGVMLLAAAVVRRRFLDGGVERLRGVLVVEAAIGVLVLAVTSGLVAETPRAVSSLAPFSTALVQGETIVNVSIAPARVGSVEIHIIVTTPGGSLDAVKSARARLSLASRGIPPIAVDPASVGPNHFVATTAIPYGGQWKLDVILVDSTDREILFTTTATIRD